MANTEFSAILNMLNEINKKVDTGFDTLDKKIDIKIGTLEKNFDAKIEVLDKKIDALEKKFDAKIDALDKKFDARFDALEEKVHNNSTNIITIINAISKIQKDIIYLRDDIDTVYSLEKDSRQQLKRLL